MVKKGNIKERNLNNLFKIPLLLLNFAYKLLRIDKDPVDRRREKIFVIVTLLAACFTGTTFSTLRFVRFFQGVDYVDLIVAFIEMGFPVVWMTNIIVFIFHQKIEILFNFFVYTGLIFMILIHFVIGAGFNSIVPFFVQLMVYWSIFLNSKLSIVNTVLINAILLGLYVYDVVAIPKIKEYQYSYISYHFGTFFGFFVVYIISYYKTKQSFKYEMILEEVAKAIHKLDLESEAVTKLNNLSNSNCTKILLLFKDICKNMLVYKTYLPPSLYCENFNSSFNSSEGSEIRSRSIRSESSMGTDLGSSIPEEKNQFEKDIFGLVEREISYMVINISKFCEMIHDLKGEDIVFLLSTYVKKVYTIVESFHGVVNTFDRDRIICTFNAVKICVLHSEFCCNAALKISQSLHGKKVRIGTTEVRFMLRISISTGKFFIGNIGFDLCRRFTIIGDLVKLNHLMNDKIKVAECERGILVDDTTASEINFKFHLRAIECVSDLNRKGVLLYKLLGVKKLNTNSKGTEWMYEIELDLLGEEDLYHQAWIEYSHKNYEKADKCIKKYMKSKKEVGNDTLYLFRKLKREVEYPKNV